MIRKQVSIQTDRYKDYVFVSIIYFLADYDRSGRKLSDKVERHDYAKVSKHSIERLRSWANKRMQNRPNTFYLYMGTDWTDLMFSRFETDMDEDEHYRTIFG